MKDKDKQIEEMAVICADCNTTCDECFEAFEKTMTLPIADREEHCQAIKYARRLFNAGYRKLSENSVVLSRATWFETQNYKYNLGFKTGKQISRKETAEKILNELVGHTFEDDGWTWTVSKEDIQWLADKQGVEIKE